MDGKKKPTKRRLFPWIGVWMMLMAWPTSGLTAERLVLANAATLLTGLIPLAQALGLPTVNGLDLEIQNQTTGDEALRSVENGQADLATIAETAFALHLFHNPDLRVVALIGGWDNEVRILARQDAAIRTPADLKGKRIGTQERLSLHFFLDQFLLKYGIGWDEVTVHFMRATDLPRALADGTVEAISAREPFLSQAQALLGNAGVMFEEPGLYYKVFLLTAKPDVIKQKGEAFKALLRTLIQAEHYNQSHPGQARHLIATSLGESAEGLRLIWPQIRFRVWLDHKFILTLEQAADWATRHHLVRKQEFPDYRAIIESGPLKSLRPIAVNLME